MPEDRTPSWHNRFLSPHRASARCGDQWFFEGPGPAKSRFQTKNRQKTAKADRKPKRRRIIWKTEKIHELVWKDQDIWFDLLWWNDDRQKITYKILSDDDYVEIEKEELNKEDESVTTNLLEFALEEGADNNLSVKIFVNDIELYDEFNDLQKDPNKLFSQPNTSDFKFHARS